MRREGWKKERKKGIKSFLVAYKKIFMVRGTKCPNLFHLGSDSKLRKQLRGKGCGSFIILFTSILHKGIPTIFVHFIEGGRGSKSSKNCQRNFQTFP